MIHYETMTISAAPLGKLNPLPDIMNNTYIHAGYKVTPSVTEEESRWIGWGMLPTMLPYLTQDGYTRERQETEIPTVVLENQYLRAVFLPTMGGRLWKLYDKIVKRDLLYVNPVFQPCNLALRNAWFSGGVEFNVGIKGHNPLTCSPMFAVRREDADGNEILSMYEYERIRGVVYSVNAWLPEDSPILFIRNIIENTAPTETPMYWWSNIAVPQNEGTRVLVPTNRSFICYYNADHYVLDKTEIPNALGCDVSYPTRIGRSLDFFYQIPKERAKWIASVERDGCGLLHFSESQLKGRKLFLWGRGAGGRHWGEFLAGAENGSGEGYIEIQAGLAHTQLEHFPMSGKSEIAFTECYAALHADADVLHGEWDSAVDAVEQQLLQYTGGMMPDIFLDHRFPSIADMKTTEVFYRGSGWGALENHVRNITGTAPISHYFNDWNTTDVAECAPWNSLLDNGRFSETDIEVPPVSYITDRPYCPDFWENRLANALEQTSQDAVLWMQYGVILYANGKKEEAEKAWQKSASLGCPWAWRNLAAYHANEVHDYDTAADEILTAAGMLPGESCIAIDMGNMLCASNNPALLQRFLDCTTLFSETVQNHPRFRLLCVRAYLALGDTEMAMQILTPDFEMPDIKEGELSVSALWVQMYVQHLMKTEGLCESDARNEVQKRYPLPYALDFRMHE